MKEYDPFNEEIHRLDVGDKPDEELAYIRKLLRHPLACLVDLTAGDEVLGVVVSLERFRKMEAAEQDQNIRIAQEQIDRGEVRPAEEVFDEIRTKLEKMKDD